MQYCRATQPQEGDVVAFRARGAVLRVPDDPLHGDILRRRSAAPFGAVWVEGECVLADPSFFPRMRRREYAFD